MPETYPQDLAAQWALRLVAPDLAIGSAQALFVLSLVAAGASGPVVVRALEPGAHQMSAVVDLAVAVLESDAATSTHKGLAAR